MLKIGIIRLEVDGNAAHALLNYFIVQTRGVGSDVHAVLGVRQRAETERGYVGQDGAPNGIGQTDVDPADREFQGAVVVHKRLNVGFGHLRCM